MQLSKKEWGNSVWIFFHVIADRINEDKFNTIKADVINVTKLICSHLPCPECSEHASKILKNINLEKVINSKDDLIKFYFNFHNHINKKLNKPQYNEAKLYSDYTSYDIKICIENINKIFIYKPIIPALMTKNFHKQLAHPRFKQLVNNIINSFI
tara:strand:+ start:1568 stop:2032 length:465 start_codon:yes stop_codon:yes gene_type:complete